MVNVFIKLLNISFSASLLILACIIIRFAFKKMPKYLRCILWVLVLIRLVCPLHLESPFSVLPKKDLISREVVVSNVSEDSSRLEERNHIGQSENITDMSENDSIIYLQNDMSANYPETVEIQSKDNLIQNNTSNYSKFLNQTSIFKLLSVIWVLGVLGSIGYGVVAYIRLKKCVSTAVRLKDNIFQTENIESPFVLGVFKAKIYIPYNLSPTEIFFVLSHERSHIARKDHLLKPFAYAVACVYWFNPLVWLGYVLLCRDIELACDEKAVNLIGYNKKKEYSQSILDFSVPKKYISACPVAFGETGVKERVKSVLNMKKGTKIAAIISALLIVIVGVGFLTYPKTKKNKTKESTTGFVTESTTEPDLGLPTEAKKEETTEETEKAKTNKFSDKKTEQKSEEQKSDNASDGENLPYTAEIDSIKEIIKSVVQDDGAAYDGSDVKVVFVQQTADGEYTSDITPDVDYSLEINKDVDGNENAIIVYTQAMGDIVATDTEGTKVDDNRVGGINVKEGSDIRSFSSGTVKTVGSNEENGNYIVITGDDGNIYSYFNLKDLPTLKEGEKIKEAQQLGKAAGIGDAEKPYFEIQVVDKKGVTKNIKIFTQNYYYYD